VDARESTFQSGRSHGVVTISYTTDNEMREQINARFENLIRAMLAQERTTAQPPRPTRKRKT
jgi:hypothetical protein